ncbi:GFA family protein [uncultured Amaricoccus sp.]|uniref:GFA family protein n=1 Tax=uncultured Amaricoccus sp. TaxID=339341 RepID=UPI002612B5EF|nr:GFA family protein [uncultured Amaricoccus sp.]
MTETYHGSCQCGAVSFDAPLDLSQPIACNCSRCRRLGAVLAFAPEAALSNFKGRENLTEYRFASEKIQHLFCRICGIQPLSFAASRDGTPMVAVNVNCLDGVDARALPARLHDGAAA